MLPDVQKSTILGQVVSVQLQRNHIHYIFLQDTESPGFAPTTYMINMFVIYIIVVCLLHLSAVTRKPYLDH